MIWDDPRIMNASGISHVHVGTSGKDGGLEVHHRAPGVLDVPEYSLRYVGEEKYDA